MNQKIAVIGAGSWGTTLANHLAKKGYRVNLWVYEKEICRTIEEKRENPIFLPNVRLHDHIKPFNDLKASVQEINAIISAPPSHVVRQIWEKLASEIPKATRVISVSKGIETKSLLTMSQAIEEVVGNGANLHLCVLSGPTFAREVSAELPTAAVAASKDPDIAIWAQKLVSNSNFRVYTSGDVIGVELGGSLKNVIALTAGISDGLNLGHNARAALLVRGIAEITRLGVSVGAEARTFSGLAGIGDLVLTSTGELSRNRTLGLRLGAGEKLEPILSGMKMVTEGVETTKAAKRLGEKEHIELPIIEQTHKVLFEGRDPRLALEELMGRDLRREFT